MSTQHDDTPFLSTACTVAEVVEAVLTYYMQHGHGVTIAQIAELESRERDEVETVFARDMSALLQLGLEPTDDSLQASDTPWEPTKGLLARIARAHIAGWTSAQIRNLILEVVPHEPETRTSQLAVRRRRVPHFKSSSGKKYVYDLLVEVESEKLYREYKVLLASTTRGACRKLAASQLPQGGRLRELWAGGWTYTLQSDGKWE